MRWMLLLPLFALTACGGSSGSSTSNTAPSPEKSPTKVEYVTEMKDGFQEVKINNRTCIFGKGGGITCEWGDF